MTDNWKPNERGFQARKKSKSTLLLIQLEAELERMQAMFQSEATRLEALLQAMRETKS